MQSKGDSRVTLCHAVSRCVTYLARGAGGEPEGFWVRGAETVTPPAVQAGGGGGARGGALPRFAPGELQRKRRLCSIWHTLLSIRCLKD